MEKEEYQNETLHVSGFVQEIVRSVSRGYFYYVKSEIPESKDPVCVDRKLTQRYQIDVSKWARARRKRAGKANLRYLRYKRLFVLVATEGEHVFLRREKHSIRDIRREPLYVFGYEIRAILGSDGRFHTDTKIAEDQYRRLRAFVREISVKKEAKEIERELHELPFEPWGGVRTQYRALRRIAERARHRAALRPWRLSSSCIRLSRKPIRAFKNIPLVDE